MSPRKHESSALLFFDLEDRSIGPRISGYPDPLTYDDGPWVIPLEIERFIPLKAKLEKRLLAALYQGSLRERFDELSKIFFWSPGGSLPLDAMEERRKSVMNWLDEPKSPLRFYRVAVGSSSDVGARIGQREFIFHAEGHAPIASPFHSFRRTCYDIAKQPIVDIPPEDLQKYGLARARRNTDGFRIAELLEAFEGYVLSQEGPDSPNPRILPETTYAEISRVYYELYWRMIDDIQSIGFPHPATEFETWAQCSGRALERLKEFHIQLKRRLDAEGHGKLIQTVIPAMDLDRLHEEFLNLAGTLYGTDLTEEQIRHWAQQDRIPGISLDPEWRRAFGSRLNSDPALFEELEKAQEPALKKLQSAQKSAAAEVKRLRNVSGTMDSLDLGRKCEAFIKEQLSGDLTLGQVDYSPEELRDYEESPGVSLSLLQIDPDTPALLRWARDPSFSKAMNEKLKNLGLPTIGHAPEPHPNFWKVVAVTPELQHLDFLFAWHAGKCKDFEGAEQAVSVLFSILEKWESMNLVRRKRPGLSKTGDRKNRGRPSLGTEKQDAALLRMRESDPTESLESLATRQDPPMTREEVEKALDRARSRRTRLRKQRAR